MNEALAPIVLFVFNRPTHTRKTLEALKADALAPLSTLYIFADGMRSESDLQGVEAVREIVQQVSGFHAVKLEESVTNRGLSKSIMEGVTAVLREHGRAIVLEDDLSVVPGFLAFMNRALTVYETDQRLFSISGWAPHIKIPADYHESAYLCRRGLCWGWATWMDRWQKVDWNIADYDAFSSDPIAVRAFAEGGDDLPDMLRNSMRGRIQSWAVRWCYAQFRANAYSLVPVKSYVTNTGQDDTGTNSKSRYVIPGAPLVVERNASTQLHANLDPHQKILNNLRKFYSYNWKAKIKRLFVEL